MVFLGVYYTLLDFGGVGTEGYTLTNKVQIRSEGSKLFYNKFMTKPPMAIHRRSFVIVLTVQFAFLRRG